MATKSREAFFRAATLAACRDVSRRALAAFRHFVRVRLLPDGTPVNAHFQGDQAAAAFIQVQLALNWLADNSLRLADWFASARRVAALGLFFDDLDELAIGAEEKMIDLVFSVDDALHLCGLSIAQHDGALMLADTDATIGRGEKVLVKGDPGAGKSTLIRAMAGLWPWGSGRILRPK